MDGAIRAGDRVAHEVLDSLLAAPHTAKETHLSAIPLPVYPPSTHMVVQPIGPTALEKWLPSPYELGWMGVFVAVVVGGVLAAVYAPRSA